MEKEPEVPEDAVVVYVYPASWKGPLIPHLTAWHLKSDEPAEALKRFTARRRYGRVFANMIAD